MNNRKIEELIDCIKSLPITEFKNNTIDMVLKRRFGNALEQGYKPYREKYTSIIIDDNIIMAEHDKLELGRRILEIAEKELNPIDIQENLEIDTIGDRYSIWIPPLDEPKKHKEDEFYKDIAEAFVKLYNE